MSDVSTDVDMAAALAVSIAEKVEQTLRPLAREMLLMRYPGEYRAIMWRAVAEKALQHESVAAKG